MTSILSRRTTVFALAAIIVLFGTQELPAQISVAPTTVVIENRSPFGEFLVANRSNTAQEIAIDFQFGFPASDENGESYIEYEDVERGADYDLGERIRAFPRRFVLPPGEQQTVRLMVRPGAGTADGGYWTRLVTTSSPRPEDVEQQELGEDITARIVFRVRQITTVLFKQGTVNTGVKVHRLDAYPENGELIVEAELEREGNAPFIGRSHLRVFNESGEVVFERQQNVSLYFDLLRRHSEPLNAFSPGEYRAEMTFEAERRDIPTGDLVPIDPVSEEVRFTLLPEDLVSAPLPYPSGNESADDPAAPTPSPEQPPDAPSPPAGRQE